MNEIELQPGTTQMPTVAHNAIAGGAAVMKVAALSRNADMLARVAEYLATDDASLHVKGWSGGAAEVAALVEQERPDMLVIEEAGAREPELQKLERVTVRYPNMAVILICADHSPDFLLRAMRTGVREVLPAPVTREALQQAVGRFRERVSWATGNRRQGKVLALLPCKGGSGATFLATNLASAIAEHDKRVCFIDLNLHFGEAVLYVSETPPASNVADVTSQIQRLDAALLESSMVRVAPNYWLLAAPDSPDRAMDVKPESVERLITVARGNYDFVLLDVSRTLDPVSIKALDGADSIYLVLQLTLPCIRDASRLMKVFRSLGYPDAKLHMLVNRYEKGGEIRLQDVERTLGVDVFKTIPNSFAAVAAAINHGRPIIGHAPHDPVSRALQDMAR